MYINAVGFFFPGAENTDQEKVSKILNEERIYTGCVIDSDESMNSREYRRMDRFSVIAMQGMGSLMQDVVEADSKSEYDVATIVNTSYGPLETNKEFIASIHEGDGSVASPIVFSHTVNNAAIGYICKKYQLKGPSTLLLSSNAFGVAEAILNDEKAKCAYVLGVDQNCPDMEGFFKEKKINVVEAAAAIELGSSKNENTYAELVAWSEGNLGGHPFFEDENIRYESVNKMIDGVMNSPEVKGENIQYAFINAFDKELIKMQEQKIESINANIKIVNLYEVIGETLGANSCMAIGLVSKLYKEGFVERDKQCLVTNYDISGNYTVYLVGGA